MAQPWRLDSWRGKPILQVPEYPDRSALEEVERHLRNFPPLVFIKEVRDLIEYALVVCLLRSDRTEEARNLIKLRRRRSGASGWPIRGM